MIRSLDGNSVQFAKRELHSIVLSPVFWALTVAIGLVLGIAGPFETDEVMRFLPRVVYWTFLSGVSFLTFASLSALTQPALTRFLPVPLSVLVAGIISSVAIFAEVVIFNMAMFSYDPDCAWCYGRLLTQIIAITVIISFTIRVVEAQIENRTSRVGTAERSPDILKRLPLEKRGKLISISVRDHYVEVVTAGGTELLFMRLSDAIAETAPIEGLQVHRSHWVALAEVRKSRRQQSRGFLTMSDGREIPVSRTCLDAAMQAGLLPDTRKR
ncbi:LytTR family DNA-binding domain-containing protein [Hoeflea poritis]|uniref:LytTR family DNA-binding domain-containing protein n=1 Tax=Hoeflea poritis TaxID=2993659 RepID=A0ABT4VRT0_9HYPH|nr:LytTR family DNA-binding domain-containing protein [Hoeflea poritis]MDA4847413.1 LytTR family DNA-binding domain-containing protein [Hoeflea poritis]